MSKYSHGVEVISAERTHIKPISRHLCWGDTIEAQAHGVSPLEMVTESLEQSVEACTITKDGTPIAMFGITKDNLMDNKATFWILSTEDIHRISGSLLRHSREFIDRWLDQYEEISNYIHAKNSKALRWAKFLGATLTPAKGYGVNGEDFVKFSFSHNVPTIVNLSALSANMEPRQRIQLFEKALLSLPNVILAGDKNAPPLQHDFTEGMYTRTISIPKGMVLTGRIHKHDHPNFLMKGKVEVYTEQEGLQTLEAPLVLMSKAGTKRVVHTLEDTVWTTVHLNPMNTTDIKALEEMLTTNDYGDVDTKEGIAI